MISHIIYILNHINPMLIHMHTLNIWMNYVVTSLSDVTGMMGNPLSFPWPTGIPVEFPLRKTLEAPIFSDITMKSLMVFC